MKSDIERLEDMWRENPKTICDKLAGHNETISLIHEMTLCRTPLPGEKQLPSVQRRIDTMATIIMNALDVINDLEARNAKLADIRLTTDTLKAQRMLMVKFCISEETLRQIPLHVLQTKLRDQVDEMTYKILETVDSDFFVQRPIDKICWIDDPLPEAV